MQFPSNTTTVIVPSHNEESFEKTPIAMTSKTTMTTMADDDEDRYIEEMVAAMAPTTLLTARSSMVSVDGGRRLSRASVQFFQRETREHGNHQDVLLIGDDGRLRDEYIMKRASVNKPATLKTIPLLADLTSDITHVDGWVLTQLLVSGYAKMSTKIDELNKINVFPIADGDTGANMKVCLKLPTRNLLLDTSDSALIVASNMAADVLLNGQGNSGTILSHFFVSLAEEIKDIGKEELTIDEFASCLVRTGAKMADAVPNPVEGTLLSVSRDACHKLKDDGHFATLKDLLESWNRRCWEELAKTPDQLIVDGVKVLEKAGVVDSGAQGFVYCVEGMYLASQGKLPEATDPNMFKTAALAVEEDVPMNVDHTVTDSKYQFCTEAVILLTDGATKKQVVEAVEEYTSSCGCCCGGGGDSVACVGAPAKGGGDMVKIHIHTNTPQLFFDKIRPFSRDHIFKKEKVEDMYVMREQMHGESQVDLSDAKFTLMGMCQMVLPPLEKSDDLHTLPVFMVPSTTQEPIDLRYASDSETINALNQQRHKDTAIRYTTATSNPMQMKIEMIAALAKEKPILLFIFSKDKRISAFGRNAMQAVEMLEPSQRKMVKFFCHGWGFYEAAFLMEAMKLAKEGKTIDEAYDALDDFAARTFNFVSFVSSPTLHRLMAWRPGLFPPGFVVKDGGVMSFGLPAEIRTGEPLSEAERAGKLMSVLGSAESLDVSMDLEAQRLRDTLQPGQKVGNILIQCVGRPDYGHNFIQKLKDVGVHIEGNPVVYNAGFLSVATSSWGEMTFMYRIVE